MKFILFLITFLGYLTVLAQTPEWWMSKSDFLSKKSGATGQTSYTNKQICESEKSPEKCFQSKDVRRKKLQEIDDLERPIYRLPKDSPVLLDCENFQDCSDKAMNPDGDLETDDNVCLSDGSKERWDHLFKHPEVTTLTGPWFIWCQKETGNFHKKDILVDDIEGSQQADIEDSQEDIRKNAKADRETKLLQCVQDTKNPTLSPIQIRDCMNFMVREILGHKVSIDDL